MVFYGWSRCQKQNIKNESAIETMIGACVMKKYIIFLISVLILGLGACNNMPSNEADTTLQTEPPQNSSAESSVQNENENILIAYFSRFGNTEYPDNVDASSSASVILEDGQRYGTTEYVARMIQGTVGGELYLIQTMEPYPEDFDTVVDQNHEEMDAGTLPELQGSALNISQYDTVFIGYPVWATNAPQAIFSFLAEYDLSGKTVIPFCTHDGYGAGGSYRDIANAIEGETQVLDGLAIESTEVSSARDTVDDWLSSIGIAESETQSIQSEETAITITVGDRVLEGVLYDTALANEIQAYFPLTVSMSGFGGREYYGGVDFYPKHLEGGQTTFENGDITYCEAHHNMAIFYAQTDDPILSVDVIPIGRVTSDLTVFHELPSQVEITFAIAE